MTTLQTLQAAVQVLQEQMRESQVHIGILYARQRLLRASTARPKTSSTCGPTVPIAATSTVTSTTPVKAALWRRTLRYLPKLAGWAAERLLAWLLPYIVPILLAGWGLLYQYGTKLWQFLLAFWHWLGL